ncbi:MAG: hypothetical protein A3I31_00515 [Candidatus Colwellbacteria bacterium RIFCSPLOWO2_02_FULL_44_20b]|uniref:Uncharacterized protein n=1 Tax=Candidatus Colwellbacteria bacterium RIFCSPLOWO2_02_FULL_44_20b TaxID=1797691 RepID=A0A1G1Z4R3_9BACT|nr:MAG: hypothetical protein A3I31_00515 [Candidatus Colwellbacteria bacterium RIFCSPLOWO2_02_FULL_44_20b]
MAYNFEKFQGQNQRYENRITITRSFSIGLPRKFYEDNLIAKKKFAVLFWDKDNKAMGIQFTDDEAEKNKFKIIHGQHSFGGSIVARSFFRGCNIDLEKYSGRYEWEKASQEGVGDLFVIKLKEQQKKSSEKASV